MKESLPVSDPSELELIEKKKCNLIFFRIPENESEIAETRIKHDYDCLVKIIGQQECDPTDIANIFRVDKKSDRPRPLIVKFHDIKIKQKYCNLVFGKELKLRVQNESIGVAVTHDKTMKQREESRRRFEQFKARQSTSADNSQQASNPDNENFQDTRQAPRPTWANVMRTFC